MIKVAGVMYSLGLRLESAIREHLPALKRGKSIDLDPAIYEHPADRPDLFRRPKSAWPVGQTCDFVLPLKDGSRVHAQCMTEGGREVIRLHRDAYDPDRSAKHWLLHAVNETPAGPLLGMALAVLVVRGLSG